MDTRSFISIGIGGGLFGGVVFSWIIGTIWFPETNTPLWVGILGAIIGAVLTFILARWSYVRLSNFIMSISTQQSNKKQ